MAGGHSVNLSDTENVTMTSLVRSRVRVCFLHGSKGIAGQVINIPVDVNSMVSELPRQLDDDLAFNVHIKRHLIHKSTGYVKKSVVKRWLRFLVTKPLYLGIRINESLYREYDNSPALAPVPEAEADASGEPTVTYSLILVSSYLIPNRHRHSYVKYIL